MQDQRPLRQFLCPLFLALVLATVGLEFVCILDLRDGNNEWAVMLCLGTPLDFGSMEQGMKTQ